MALTADRKMEHREGVEIVLPVAGSTTIYAGDLVALDASGYLAPGADTAAYSMAGVARAYVDNSAGSDGDAACLVARQGIWRLPLATAATQANVGDTVYLAGDGKVDLAANTTNDIAAGKLVELISATEAWVDISSAT
jgi:predicted RecA/RadA family phage recombinase